MAEMCYWESFIGLVTATKDLEEGQFHTAEDAVY